MQTTSGAQGRLQSVPERDSVVFAPMTNGNVVTEEEFVVHLEHVECDKENKENSCGMPKRRDGLLAPKNNDDRRMSLHLDLLD